MHELSQLRQLGLKATAPRLKVLEILRSGPQRHLSADDVHRALLLEHADVSLATVYRVLSQLEQAGILSRRSFDTGPAVYEIDDGGHHDHLVCVHCGLVTEFTDAAIEARQAQVAATQGFQLSEHRLVLYGRCRLCRSDAADAAR